ncbi:hypothetical protein ACJJTC_003098 [Scirpophaga incertulas]
MQKTTAVVLTLVLCVSSDVLDPALFLVPSPPLSAGFDSIPPGERWTQLAISRVTRDAQVLPESTNKGTEETESMSNAETFWPKLRTTSFGLGGIHIPMTFSVSGTYGGGLERGVYGSSYGSVSDGIHPGLAGSSYGIYRYPGIRVFGNTGKRGWTGWGNGKWGHYGKG